MKEHAFPKGNAGLAIGGQQCIVLSDSLRSRRQIVENIEKWKKLGRLLEELGDKCVFVEGQKDKQALLKLGFVNILTISGNMDQSIRKVDCGQVVVLTDLDRRGDQLAQIAKNKLESASIKADLESRKHLAYLLNIRFFEDAYRAYEKLKGEIYG